MLQNYDQYLELGKVQKTSTTNYGLITHTADDSYSLFDANNMTYQILGSQRGIIINTAATANGLNIPSITDLLG